MAANLVNYPLTVTAMQNQEILMKMMEGHQAENMIHQEKNELKRHLPAAFGPMHDEVAAKRPVQMPIPYTQLPQQMRQMISQQQQPVQQQLRPEHFAQLAKHQQQQAQAQQAMINPLMYPQIANLNDPKLIELNKIFHQQQQQAAAAAAAAAVSTSSSAPQRRQTIGPATMTPQMAQAASRLPRVQQPAIPMQLYPLMAYTNMLQNSMAQMGAPVIPVTSPHSPHQHIYVPSAGTHHLAHKPMVPVVPANVPVVSPVPVPQMAPVVQVPTPVSPPKQPVHDAPACLQPCYEGPNDSRFKNYFEMIVKIEAQLRAQKEKK